MTEELLDTNDEELPLDDDKLVNDVINTKNSLSTSRMDMSFGEIMNMYERNEIIIDPEFQRLFRWSIEQQTRFIESILLGIPIPPIFVAEDKNGRWELVDGLQRISTVLSFFGILRTLPEKNKWAFSKGELVESLENYDCNKIPLKINLNIKRAICRIEIVNWNSIMDMRYELFNRLNTGGSPLTEQEIRNCIFRGTSSNFNNFLTRMADDKLFSTLVRPTKRQKEQKYLEELVLRFVSLMNNEWENSDNWVHTGDKLSAYMTSFMKKAITDQNFDFDSFETLFKRVLRLLEPLGPEVFRGLNSVFSTSYYDAATVGIATYINYYENIEKSEIEKRMNELRNNPLFLKNVGAGSSTKNRVINRIRISLQIFKPE
ncbi:DUF262 domain-containing protein [Methanosarcina sp.]|uniref:DUF262 domain-containing protein n=1 Tax=Methanosarcina sp. TaxID=2213 RepID=UPI002AB9A0CC|nr:DUF262 domain-containing protein [Methanosarcina sp.]MDY9924829.1 DUF262 domain-containing protein [Methanosarcina sp.]